MAKQIYIDGNRRFRITKNNENHFFGTGTIYAGITPNCEVSEITDGNVPFGVISHKALVYIATEIATYASKRYFENYEMKDALEIARRWIDNPSSVSEDELNAITNPILYNNFVSLYLIKTIIYPDAYFYYICREIAEGSSRFTREYLRQGEFIIDFLKSDKHLFIR
jgi:hypothetical protein